MHTPTLAMFRFSLRCLVLSISAVVLSHAAVLVAPISGQFPDTFGACSGCTQLAYKSQTVVSSNGKFTATLNAAVYSDPGNTFCAGCLDFVYQIANSSGSTDNIGRITVVDFNAGAPGGIGWEVDAGYSTSGAPAAGGTAFPTGTIAPGLVDRNTNDTVGFQFSSSPSTSLPQGSVSTVLVIETNATYFTTGSALAIDGGTANYSAFAPSVTNPLTFTATSLPPGMVGVPYSQTLPTTGGTLPLHFYIIAGRLPAGLTLNGSTGQISGTPQEAGESSSLTFLVTDSGSSQQTATANIVMAVN